MSRINYIFDRMDEWRHLPNYQLERRADLFFSLYLPEVLEAKLGFSVRQELIPEFPVHKGTIYPDELSNKSFKIDYLALSDDAEKAVFVELKTDKLSIRHEQDKYLTAAQRVGMKHLLVGLREIFRATESKRKYFHLLEKLESMELLKIHDDIKNIMKHPHLQGVNEESHYIEITSRVKDPATIVYVQPNGSEKSEANIIIISFQEFRAIVKKHNDPISKRFAQSLSEWAQVKAGEKT